MPSIRFSLTRAAMSAISRALFTWYGISVTMIARGPWLMSLDGGPGAHFQVAAAARVGVENALRPRM